MDALDYYLMVLAFAALFYGIYIGKNIGYTKRLMEELEEKFSRLETEARQLDEDQLGKGNDDE